MQQNPWIRIRLMHKVRIRIQRVWVRNTTIIKFNRDFFLRVKKNMPGMAHLILAGPALNLSF
jgi:hypothetical protein